MGKIFYIMGKSSSGKDTIYKKLISDESLGFNEIVGYTTRPIREGETDGKEYFFVSEDKMNDMKNAGKIIEHRAYNTVYGVWNYFTADDGQIDFEKNDYLLIGTLESYENICKYYGKDVMVPIYVYVEDGLRLERALMREKTQSTPKYAEMCRRFLADESDFSEENIKRNNIDTRFENIDLEQCLKEIKEYILSFR